MANVKSTASTTSSGKASSTPAAKQDFLAHSAFELISQEHVPSLDVTVQEFSHKETQARHYHLAADNEENVFLVALKTVPTDSTGVAHILEHTALCGSEKYPVRDPFFMMLRRSINTFMNAFTSSDWTAYPFASQNRKDFDNLLSVYLDAVFFSRIDELDFLQEGHRLEFSELEDPKSELCFKGVVFNEMKGAMSAESSVLYQTMSKYLFPTTTYHFNSGGEPEHIPDLSYAQLQSFYQQHYHPSNAVFFTFGNISAKEHQTVFEENVLSKFQRSTDLPKVTLEKRYHSPIAVEESYSADTDTENKTHITLSWLLGESSDLELSLKAHLLTSALLDNSASPLRKVLETSDLGKSPSPLCGLEDSNREMSFSCGLEGSNETDVNAVEKLVLDCLHEVKANGIPMEQVEAVLHQLELSQREIGGDGYPYGLQLILTGLSPSIHGASVSGALNLDPVIEKLREEIKDKDFIPNLLDELLLQNNHRVRLTLKPDLELSAKKIAAEKSLLEEIKNDLSQQELDDIIDKSKALLERQEMVENEDILPKVGREDVPKTIDYPLQIDKTISKQKLPLSYFNQGTNGLVYQQVIVDLPNFSEAELLDLSCFSKCFTELGHADKDYLQVQLEQSQLSGGIGAHYSYKSLPEDGSMHGHFVVSGKALKRNSSGLNGLIHQSFKKVRFDEESRIAELITQIRTGREQSITSNGHALAMMLASSGMSVSAHLTNKLSGIEQIAYLKKLDDALQGSDGLSAMDKLVNNFKQMHEKLLDQPMQLLLVSEEKYLEEIEKNLNQSWQDEKAAKFAAIALPNTFIEAGGSGKQVNQFWSTNTQVNFCAKVFKAVNIEHKDAAALTVLGGYLRNGYLHKAIREKGGAYGGGASFDPANACFRFFSYRDPRMAETLADFDASVDWMLSAKHPEDKLEEAILGVISDIDKPGSPAGQAKQSFHASLYGRTPEKRRVYREQILGVTLDDLLSVSKEYLTTGNASTAVIGGAERKDQARDLGLEVVSL